MRSGDQSDAKRGYEELLEKDGVPLFISMKCHFMLGGVCKDVMQAKHHLLYAKKHCENLLAQCLEEDREQVLHSQGIVLESLEELKPEERQFRMEMGEFVNSSDEEEDDTD